MVDTFEQERSLEFLQGYEKDINDYREKISYYDEKLKSPLSETKRECYEKLKEICENRIVECEANIRRLMNGGYGEINFGDDGSEVAEWQREVHKGEKTLPYKEWKKKYGERFTKVFE